MNDPTLQQNPTLGDELKRRLANGENKPNSLDNVLQQLDVNRPSDALGSGLLYAARTIAGKLRDQSGLEATMSGAFRGLSPDEVDAAAVRSQMQERAAQLAQNSHPEGPAAPSPDVGDAQRMVESSRAALQAEETNPPRKHPERKAEIKPIVAIAGALAALKNPYFAADIASAPFDAASAARDRLSKQGAVDFEHQNAEHRQRLTALHSNLVASLQHYGSLTKGAKAAVKVEKEKVQNKANAKHADEGMLLRSNMLQLMGEMPPKHADAVARDTALMPEQELQTLAQGFRAASKLHALSDQIPFENPQAWQASHPELSSYFTAIRAALDAMRGHADRLRAIQEREFRAYQEAKTKEEKQSHLTLANAAFQDAKKASAYYEELHRVLEQFNGRAAAKREIHLPAPSP